MTNDGMPIEGSQHRAKRFRIQSALIGDKWIDDCLLLVENGLIVAVEKMSDDEMKSPASNHETIEGCVVPGVVNVHSHAFQRGFAGLSEFRTLLSTSSTSSTGAPQYDSFWSWRKLMYDFVWKLSPEDAYVIAKQVYLEMLAVGYTWVGEFHYLHNDKEGKQFQAVGEMSDALMNAAKDAGIGIRLLPTLYQQGGFGRELEAKQKRFELNEDQFVQLVVETNRKWKAEPHCQVGMAIHSLRAVDVSVGRRVVESIRSELPNCPIHIHVSEQLAELEECQAATGKTPINFLYDSFDVDESWCLIHATHANQSELSMIAQSGAVIGLCPTTEANLGDGIFPAEEFLAMNGRFAVGSDSHVAINLASELRTIEYGQRLSKHRRAVLGSESESVGARLFRSAAKWGGKAIGAQTGTLTIGNRADFLVVDSAHAAIAGVRSDRLLDRLVFCEHENPISKTFIAGESVDVRSRLDSHRNDFVQTMMALHGS